MRVSEIFFWVIWIVTLGFIIIILSSYTFFNLILFIILLILTGIAMYSRILNTKKFHWLKIKVKNIDFRPLEEGISRIEKKQKESNLKLFKFERKLNDFENYKIEQEKKYRDVVRKVLELDNELNKKYKLLGESVIKLKKDMKK